MREILKEDLVRKLGGSCQLCGYNKCLAALHFHHINPHEKEFNISSKNHFWEVEKEIQKCILLCANCHTEVHAGLVDHETLTMLKEFI